MLAGSETTPPAIGRVDAEALKRRFDEGRAIMLLDVREPMERSIAAIKPPDHVVELAIPMGEIPARHDEVARLAGSMPIVIYCHHGQRSMVVARWLALRGLAGLINLEGGIDAWSRRVDPSTPRY